MRRLLLIALFVVAVTSVAVAQRERTVERSATTAPRWIGMADRTFFSVSATAATISEAQSAALAEIRQHIVSSVAVSITSDEMLSQDAISQDGMTSLLTRYSSQVETHAAELPFLCGISLSKADDIYWERRFVKGEKRYYYIYHVRYPFSDAERNEAIAEFRKMDDARMARLTALRSALEAFTDIGFVDGATAELSSLAEYFFDSSRRRDALSLRAQYFAARSSATVVCDSSIKGECRYHIEIAGRRVVTAIRPALRSNYAAAMQIKQDGDGYLLTYEPYGVSGEDNIIEIVYPFGIQSRCKVLFEP